MTNLLLAKPLIEDTLPKLKDLCSQMSSPPKMRVILVGENQASVTYVKHKEKQCEKIGALFDLVKLPLDISRDDFLQEIEKLNSDNSIHGGFVQLPLPKHLSDIDTTELIAPEKDVDGFGVESFIGLIKNNYERGFIPCTPKGIMTLFETENIDLTGKKATVIGRSLIVGKPMALLLQNAGATVTMCHSRTRNLKEHTLSADIIISAVGKTKFLNADYFQKDQSQVLIDVGMNRDEENKLCGDIDFESVKDNVKAITPVPGGVGPMTVLSLMENLVLAKQRQEGK
tara:strand:+ start:75245 stop:76099 length:855 start_codon:yes stop_codon:yes gene_type:complete